MDTRTILEKVKKSQGLTVGEARWFGYALSGRDISDAQAGAFAMGVCLNGLDAKARVALTEGMRDSGDVLQWDLPGPVVDKHSTGGVGDAVSLILAPALAELGVYVPMISGRGLGHTGGTLDKLESIPGYICEIGPKRLENVVQEVGAAIVGATGRVAPSDKRLYAIRDISSTVESIDLITASILSKKLAAGLDALILDVKTGSGAFMEAREDSRALAQSLVDVANGAGCKTEALITDMSQPLANAAGNAVEVRVVMEVLSGSKVHGRLVDVSCSLGGAILALSGLFDDRNAAEKRVRDVIENGAALERFARMVSLLGGPLDFAESWRHCLPESPVVQEVLSGSDGYVTEIDTRTLGQAVVGLGGGRQIESDRIDPAVGLTQIVPLGTKVDRKSPLMMIHAATETQAQEAVSRVQQAIKIGPKTQAAPEVILEHITP